MADPSTDAGPGVVAYEAGDYARAHDLLKPAAEAGDIQARYLMARLLAGGLSARTDYEAALDYLDEDVRCYSPEALNLFAFVFRQVNGAGYSVVLKEMSLYKEAAEAGSIRALTNLGIVLSRDFGEDLLGGSYIVEAGVLGDEEAAKTVERLKRLPIGGKAYLEAKRLVEEKPLQERRPLLDEHSMECRRFSRL